MFAVLVVVAMSVLNILGSQVVARAQTIVVIVVIGILTIFAVTTLANLDPDLLAFSGYPPLRDIVSSVALTFFAFLGFGVITFTAKDLADPARQLPRAVFLALGIATVVYVAVALGVFGTLTVDEVDRLRRHRPRGGGRARPRERRVLADERDRAVRDGGRDERGALPGGRPVRADGVDRASSRRCSGRRFGDRAPAGSARHGASPRSSWRWASTSRSIASLGSAVALIVFTLVTAGHLRVHQETGARPWLLVVAIASTVVVLATFAVTTLVEEPATAVALVGILLLSILLDLGWKRSRDAHAVGR